MSDSTLPQPAPQDNPPDWLADARDWERLARQQPTDARRQYCLDRADFCYHMTRLDATVYGKDAQ